ncbi:hypothetical protein [Streptomyces sp. NPDC000931]
MAPGQWRAGATGRAVIRSFEDEFTVRAEPDRLPGPADGLPGALEGDRR